ncbi:MAG TPA: alcohol dehydrogenase [Planctomycetes bacterium]|nr:alcohol dehydrogenase [Planctomycetota bacterium]
MPAMVIREPGGPEVLTLQDVPVPRVGEGQVLVRVRAFGVNRAETYFRSGAWGEASPVSGIECVGQVEEDPSGELAVGTKVFALMGGMGRTLSGSYGAFVSVPSTNVVPIESLLPWDVLAALPESFATAHACLVERLHLEEGERIVIRGATSALGRAAIVLAHSLGASVVATSRRVERFPALEELGAEEVLIHDETLADEVRRRFPGGVDAVLDLIGNRSLLDSMRMVRANGRVCLAGFLGGGEPIVSFDPLTQMPPSVDLSFFASFLFGTPGVPVPKEALQGLVRRVERGELLLEPAHVFGLEELPKAHRMMEENRAEGKIVVLHA